MVDDLSDFSKGQAFECFHCYKQAYCNSLLCILFIPYFSLFLLSFLFIVFLYMYFFSFDATILVNKYVYIIVIYQFKTSNKSVVFNSLF